MTIFYQRHDPAPSCIAGRVLAAVRAREVSIADLASDLGLDVQQVRDAVDRLRNRHGYLIECKGHHAPLRLKGQLPPGSMRPGAFVRLKTV